MSKFVSVSEVAVEETDVSSKLRFSDNDLTKEEVEDSKKTKTRRRRRPERKGLINGCVWSIHGITSFSESTRYSRLLPTLLLRRRFIGDEAWFILHQTERTMHAAVIVHSFSDNLDPSWRVGISFAESDLTRLSFFCFQVLEQQEGGVAEDGAGEIDGGENVRSDGGERAVEI